MKVMYTPYTGKKPVPFTVNGHKLLIISSDQELFEENLERVGAERIGTIRFGDTMEEERAALDRLAEAVEGGVVVASADLELDEILANLSRELPWIH